MGWCLGDGFGFGVVARRPPSPVGSKEGTEDGEGGHPAVDCVLGHPAEVAEGRAVDEGLNAEAVEVFDCGFKAQSAGHGGVYAGVVALRPPSLFESKEGTEDSAFMLGASRVLTHPAPATNLFGAPGAWSNTSRQN